MFSLFAQFDARPRTLFIDMNSFYTSVEQQECKAYRGKPTIVVPVLTETTCAIAASYEVSRTGLYCTTLRRGVCTNPRRPIGTSRA